jgi:hypothetical protein
MPAGSTAARPLAPASQRWHRRCQEATTTLLAALRSGGSGSSAAHIAQLRTLWRCPAGSAVCIVAPPAASRPHWRCIRAAPEPAAPRGSASDHVAVPTRSAGPKSRENRDKPLDPGHCELAILIADCGVPCDRTRPAQPVCCDFHGCYLTAPPASEPLVTPPSSLER